MNASLGEIYEEYDVLTSCQADSYSACSHRQTILHCSQRYLCWLLLIWAREAVLLIRAREGVCACVRKGGGGGGHPHILSHTSKLGQMLRGYSLVILVVCSTPRQALP